MKRPGDVFIRSEYRPDLRALLDARSFQLKGCVEKGDPDKDKEIAKDDQARGPVRDRSVAAREGAIVSDQASESAYATIFA
jgi:hypothetical protein